MESLPTAFFPSLVASVSLVQLFTIQCVWVPVYLCISISCFTVLPIEKNASCKLSVENPDQKSKGSYSNFVLNLVCMCLAKACVRVVLIAFRSAGYSNVFAVRLIFALAFASLISSHDNGDDDDDDRPTDPNVIISV